MKPLSHTSLLLGWAKRAFMGIAMVLCVVSLVGCGAPSDQANQGNERAHDNILRMASFMTIGETLDPAQGWTAWSDTFYGFGEPLFVCDANLVPQPVLVQNLERVDDLTWRLTVKEGVLFHNGQHLDGASVKRSLEYALKNNVLAKELLPLQEMTADENVVTLTTKQPLVALANVLANPVFVIQYIDEEGQVPSIPVMSGPFIPTEFVAADHISARAFEDYHGGKPALDGLYIQQFNDPQAKMLALESDQVDLVTQVPLATAKPALEKAQGSLKESSALGTRGDGVIVNTKSKYFASNHARQAIGWALDRSGYQVMTQGLCVPSYTLFPDSISTLTPQGFQPQVTSYSLDKARDEFVAAGFEFGDDGVMRFEGNPVNIRVLTYQYRPEFKYMAEHLKSELQKIGVSVEVIETKDFDADAVARGDFDLAMDGLVLAGTGDPAYYYRSSLVSGASTNYSAYANPAFDALVDEYTSTWDDSKRSEIQKQILELLDADKPYIAYADRSFSIFMRDRVQGVEAHPSEYYAINEKTSLAHE